MLWEKVAQMPLLTYFSWVGVALGWGGRRFHNNIYMFSKSTRLMYHEACKVEFQPFKRPYSQLTIFNFL